MSNEGAPGHESPRTADESDDELQSSGYDIDTLNAIIEENLWQVAQTLPRGTTGGFDA